MQQSTTNSNNIINYGHEFFKDRIGSDGNIKQYSSDENRKQHEKPLHSGCTSLCVFKDQPRYKNIPFKRFKCDCFNSPQEQPQQDDNFVNAYGYSREEHENNKARRRERGITTFKF
ncbi:hypothetical protein ACTFIV_004992 [Dictyostelium citrinum]